LIALVAGNTFYQLLIALAIVAVLLTIFRYKWFLKAGKGCSSRDFLKKAKPREK
jgi:Tfp pilus assembly protein PilE